MILSRTKPAIQKTSSASVSKKNEAPMIDDFLSKRDFIGAMTLAEFETHLSESSTPSLESLLWLGYAAFHAADYTKALEVYTRIIRTYADVDKVVFVYQAICYFYLGMYDESEKAVLKAPSSKLANRLLFHISQKQGDEKKLMEYHHKLQDVFEDQMTLAAIHYLRTHYQEAIDVYKKLLMDHRDYIAINVYVALAYYRLEFYDVSQDVLNVYFQRHPDSVTALNLRACNIYRLYGGKAAEEELKPLVEKVNDRSQKFGADIVKHNQVVFRNGENSLQILPDLCDVLPEARLNLVIYHLKNDDIMPAYELLKDLDPSTPQEYILKGIVNAVLGQEQDSKEHLKIAQQYFQIVGSSASECDTIPGRQCMASCFFLMKQYEDVMIYLNSIKEQLFLLEPYYQNDETFNLNFGQTKVALGEYKEAEDIFLNIQSESARNEFSYISHLAKCFIMNNKAEKAWDMFLKMETSGESFQILQLIAHDSFKTSQYLYSAKAFDALNRLDASSEHWEGKRAACIALFQQIVEHQSPNEHLMDLANLLRDTSHPQIDYLVKIIRRWTKENGINGYQKMNEPYHPASLREAYQTFGVKTYYENHGSNYLNPHKNSIIKCISQMLQKIQIQVSVYPSKCHHEPLFVYHDKQLKNVSKKGFKDLKDDSFIRFLDLACGSGEATMGIYQWLKVNESMQVAINACDPYTKEAFHKIFNVNPDSYSFYDVSQYCYSHGSFDVTICSFALHLIDDDKLYSTLYALSYISEWLLVLPPNKQPFFKPSYGWELVESLTIERVHARAFKSFNYQKIGFAE